MEKCKESLSGPLAEELIKNLDQEANSERLLKTLASAEDLVCVQGAELYQGMLNYLSEFSKANEAEINEEDYDAKEANSRIKIRALEEALGLVGEFMKIAINEQYLQCFDSDNKPQYIKSVNADGLVLKPSKETPSKKISYKELSKGLSSAYLGRYALKSWRKTSGKEVSGGEQLSPWVTLSNLVSKLEELYKTEKEKLLVAGLCGNTKKVFQQVRAEN